MAYPLNVLRPDAVTESTLQGCFPAVRDQFLIKKHVSVSLP